MITILIQEDTDIPATLLDVSAAIKRDIDKLQKKGIKCLTINIRVSDWRDNEHK